MQNATYLGHRSQIETRFTRTATDAPARLTSDAPIIDVSASMRGGGNKMRQMLDATCGFFTPHALELIRK